MQDVIDLLEALGRAPLLQGGGIHAHDMAGLDSHVRVALSQGDAGTLSGLLGGRAEMMCNILLPEDDEPRREESPDHEGDVPDEAEARRLG
jgi:hypothetical protein